MITVERILCPIDLSEGSSRALQYAIECGLKYGANLEVCYCVREGATIGEIRKAQQETENTVERAFYDRGREGERQSIKWQSRILEGSDPADTITREAERRSIDLIVMSSRRRPLRAALLGSTAETVYRTAPCPVFISHPDDHSLKNSPAEASSFKRILVAHDFSDYSELALEYALSIAQEHQAELHLLHVLDPPLFREPELAWTTSTVEGSYHKAARALQQSVPAEAQLWCSLKTAVRWGTPYRETLEYAKEHAIDLISMGAHGVGIGIHALIGSNVDRVLRLSPCPLLVVRPLGEQRFSALVTRPETQKRMVL